MRNPEIVALADDLDRTVGSVTLKMTNLASIDDSLDRKGMANASALDRATWSAYFKDLAMQAAQLPSESETPAIPEMDDHQQQPLLGIPDGVNVPRIVNVRQGQDFFRGMILSNYSERCAISDIEQPVFLVAGHIRAWSKDAENRLNPRNGICLNRLHDKAFEDGLIAIEDDGRVLYSKELKPVTRAKLEELGGEGRFRMPTKFRPDPLFLEYHRDCRFQR